MTQPATDPGIHRARRARLMEQLGDGLILVRGQGPEGGNGNFFYLTGIAEPRGVLVLAATGARLARGRSQPGPDYVRGRMVRELLFLPSVDPLAARWGEDASATVESVGPAAAGVDEVLGVAEMPAVLSRMLLAVTRVHYVRAQDPVLGGEDDADTVFAATLARRFLHLRVEDATGAVHEMRRLKDAEEVRGVERAVAVVAEALERASRLVRPGAREYEIEAEIARTYRSYGGVHAFEPIVASGPRALLLHYRDNSGTLAAGELLLVDTGVSIGGYKADISRTWPVGGRFDARQRELYAAVLDAEEQVIAACRPGALLGDLHALAWQVLERGGLAEHFPHGIGHYLGLATHDAGDVHRPLHVGAVITVEPGVYVEREGIGIRIEDDVLIEPDGRRVLSAAIPRRADEIERAMAAPGR